MGISWPTYNTLTGLVWTCPFRPRFLFFAVVSPALFIINHLLRRPQNRWVTKNIFILYPAAYLLICIPNKNYVIIIDSISSVTINNSWFSNIVAKYFQLLVIAMTKHSKLYVNFNKRSLIKYHTTIFILTIILLKLILLVMFHSI